MTTPTNNTLENFEKHIVVQESEFIIKRNNLKSIRFKDETEKNTWIFLWDNCTVQACHVIMNLNPFRPHQHHHQFIDRTHTYILIDSLYAKLSWWVVLALITTNKTRWINVTSTQRAYIGTQNCPDFNLKKIESKLMKNALCTKNLNKLHYMHKKYTCISTIHLMKHVWHFERVVLLLYICNCGGLIMILL